MIWMNIILECAFYYNLFNCFLDMVTMIPNAASFKSWKQFIFMLSENAINYFGNSSRFEQIKYEQLKESEKKEQIKDIIK